MRWTAAGRLMPGSASLSLEVSLGRCGRGVGGLRHQRSGRRRLGGDRRVEMEPGPGRACTTLDARRCVKYSGAMKSASVQQLPQQWPEILRWVVAGEEVQVTDHDQVVARVVPPSPAATPDFLARAKAIWGEVPSGNALSAVASEAR